MSWGAHAIEKSKAENGGKNYVVCRKAGSFFASNSRSLTPHLLTQIRSIMSPLHIRLFGKFSIQYDNSHLLENPGHKVQELIAFLSLHRDKMHSREWLASLLWNGECTTAQSRKYLRKTLWKMQRGLQSTDAMLAARLLHVEHEWIMLNSIEELHLDVVDFENIYTDVQGCAGESLSAEQVRAIENAIESYRDGLLLNLYVDWCFEERERFQWIYLTLLDKLIRYAEHVGNLEKAISLTKQILLVDEARECSHRSLMALYYRAGDRTAALRQFKRCEEKLAEELDTRPCDKTLELYKKIEEGIPMCRTVLSMHSDFSQEQSTVAFRAELRALFGQAKDLVNRIDALMQHFSGPHNGAA